jgi:hypothetical protein
MANSNPNQPPVVEGMDARWLRFLLSGDPPPIDQINNITMAQMKLLAPSLGYPLPTPLVGTKSIYIPQNAAPLHYAPAHRCIYCGSSEYRPGDAERKLGEEHIIAGGLGASLTLYRASCHAHEKLTSGIETKLLQRLFDPIRKQLDIRGRDKKPLLKGNFEVHHMVDGKNVALRLPISDHPTVLFLAQMGPPGILTGRPKWLHGITGAWMININATKEKLQRRGMKSFASPGLDTVLFSKMLCKIGHSVAAAEVLTENFDPLALGFLLASLGKTEHDDRRDYFVGGNSYPEPPTPYLHELGLGLYEAHDRTFLIARIRLFAFLGAPAYFVTVGTVPASKRGIVIARLSNNNSCTHPL